MSVADIEKFAKLLKKNSTSLPYQKSEILAIINFITSRNTVFSLQDDDYDKARALLVSGGIRCYMDANYVKARQEILIGNANFMSTNTDNLADRYYLYIMYYVILSMVTVNLIAFSNGQANSLSDIGVPPVIAQKLKLFSKVFIEDRAKARTPGTDDKLGVMINIGIRRLARLVKKQNMWKD